LPKGGGRVDSSAPSVHDVRSLVAATLHAEVAEIERDILGASNATYFIRLADSTECVVRISPIDQSELLAQQIWALHRAAEAGLPVPTIFAADHSPADFPAPYMVMSRLPGVPAYRATLTQTVRATVLEQLGEYLARLHSITLSGFGPLVAHGAEYAGRFKSWWEYIEDECLRRVQALPEEILSRQHAAEIRERLEAEQVRLDTPTASLIHGDYQLKNVLVQGDRVTGIVDFENLVAGDPVADFAPLHFWSEQPARDLAALCRGYGMSYSLGLDSMHRLYVYELLLAFEILRWEHRFNDTAGIARMNRRLREIQTVLGAYLEDPRR
jgi:hygromycin-B 7''-O-kinase